MDDQVVPAGKPFLYTCEGVDHLPNRQLGRCKAPATHLHYVTRPGAFSENEIKTSAGITPVCARHGQQMVDQRNVFRDTSEDAGVKAVSVSNLVPIPDMRQGAKALNSFPREHRNKIHSILEKNVLRGLVPSNALEKDLETEDADYGGPTGGLRTTRVSPEADATAHFNRLEEARLARRRERGREATRRSRGLPATPAQRSGRPYSGEEAGSVDVTQYSLRKFETGSGLEVNPDLTVTRREDEIEGEGKKAWLRRAQVPNRGIEPLKLQTMEEVFPATANAPLDSDLTAVRPRVRDTDDLTEETAARASNLNLVGAKRDAVSLRGTDKASSGALSAKQNSLLGIEAGDTLGSSEGMSSTPRETSKAYPLAIMKHHSEHPMAWHQGKPVMVEAVPAFTDEEEPKFVGGYRAHHWVPTKEPALTREGRPYTEDEMSAATPYRHVQAVKRRRSEEFARDALEAALKDKRAGRPDATTRSAQRTEEND